MSLYVCFFAHQYIPVHQEKVYNACKLRVLGNKGGPDFNVKTLKESKKLEKYIGMFYLYIFLFVIVRAGS